MVWCSMLKRVGIICCGGVVEVADAVGTLLKEAIQNPRVIVCIVVIAIIICAHCSVRKTKIVERSRMERTKVEETAKTERHKDTMQTLERVIEKLTETEQTFLPPHDPQKVGNVRNFLGYYKRKAIESILESATNGEEERNSPAHSEDDESKLPWHGNQNKEY